MGKLKEKFILLFAQVYLYLVGKSSKIKFFNHYAFEELKKDGKPFIYALWHGRQFFLVYTHRFQEINVLVSRSRDGEYIAQTLERFGFSTMRGSTGMKKGGMRALVQIIKSLKQGETVAFTPDGPQGPAQKVQLGVIIAAQKTGCPIVPLTYSAKYKKIIKNWDEYIIPYPFNNIVVMHGEPFYVSAQSDPEEKAKELEQILNQISAEADLRCGGKF